MEKCANCAAYDGVSEIRMATRSVTGGNSAFVDDDLLLLTCLAQRAILAGLHESIKDASIKNKMSELAEAQREKHEKDLGSQILSHANLS